MRWDRPNSSWRSHQSYCPFESGPGGLWPSSLRRLSPQDWVRPVARVPEPPETVPRDRKRVGLQVAQELQTLSARLEFRSTESVRDVPDPPYARRRTSALRLS